MTKSLTVNSTIYLKAKVTFIFIHLFSGLMTFAASYAFANNDFALLPAPTSNNAVTQVISNNQPYLLSFSGLGKSKTYEAVNNKAFIYDVNNNQWKTIEPVPIAEPINKLSGRLASVATSIGHKAYIFGGYTVDKDHSEVSVPDVYSYDVSLAKYEPLASMPVPVDDSVALPYDGRYIYLVSGWHNDGNVNLVQVYDTLTDTWQQASPFPGKPVFGQAGGIVGNKLVICDGVRVDVHMNKGRSYAAETNCYFGSISPDNPNKIAWELLPHPTGKSRYRMAAVGVDAHQKIVFFGGSHNPYNYNGIGYNGAPSIPDNGIWNFDVKSKTWQVMTADIATMDHRGLLLVNDQLITVGGMGSDQKVLQTINSVGDVYVK